MAAAKNASSKDVASLQVSLPQMLDLALGTPEVGAVNLNILHNFLHILLYQIDLGSTKVEYRGDDASRIKTMVSSMKAGPMLHLQEYSIIDAANNVKQRIQTDDPNLKVDVVTESKPDEGVSKVKGTRQKISPEGAGEAETVIYVEPVVDGSIPSALGFKRLEQSVRELRKRFQALEELATTSELIERVKGKVTDPVTDVWQIISITKRLDASEQGIDKLTKMMQDVMKGDVGAVAEMAKMAEVADVAEETDEAARAVGAAGTAGTDTSALENRLGQLESALENLNQIVTNLQIISDTAEDTGEEILVGKEPPAAAAAAAPAEAAAPAAAGQEKESGPPAQRISLSQLLGGIDVKQMNQDMSALQKEVSEMKDALRNLKSKMETLQDEVYQAQEQSKKPEKQPEKKPEKKPQKEPEVEHTPEMDGDKAETTETGEQSDRQTETAASARDSPEAEPPEEEYDASDPEELRLLKQRIAKVEKDVICLFEKVEGAPMAGAKGSAELDDLVSKIQGIQSDMDKLHQTADRLIDDRENRETHLNALLEQVELLKTIKADREDLEDALADKADAQAIHRKVSYDQFDAACDDLAHGLEEAIHKLGKQESIWQEALDEVQKEIEGKVDKIEMTPLKDFVNTRLKSLQEKVKSVAQLRQESEAAGSKKLLRDVQCISCDKNVVMRMEDTHKFRPETLPCTASIKPYLTYELDQVRKQNRRLPHSRNMLQFEAALHEETKKHKSPKVDTLVKTPRDHLCNRYCGGSHTVTTPQQRVMRMGHFITQWGPEIVQLTEGMIKGTDGKMYKSRPMPGKFDVCGPNYCEDQGEEEKSASASQRKSPEKQPNGRKRPSKRQSRELNNELLDKLVETVEEDDARAGDMSSAKSSERGVRYYNDENMDDLE